jgi:CDP-glycerol glycerophosphotransferase (TagB/SpsB family)
VLSQANAGQGIARNRGVDAARGEFLTFMDSDDVLPRDAYASMVEGLRRSGSDFSVGNLRRLRHGRLSPLIWSRTVHRQDRIGTTIEEFPNAMQDIIACNRMFRTAFWREQVGAFEGGIAYEDHVPMLTAYVRARAFDVLQRVTYHWRIREDLTSTGQQKARIANLRDRITVKEQAHELLVAEASDAVYAAWVGRTLEVDFPPFLPHALAGDADYRSLLAATYRTFLDRATPQAFAMVRVAMRLRAHLAAEERWEDLFAADDYLREVQNTPPTRVVDGQLVADFPPECAWADALPGDLRWMAPLESHFEGAVEHLEWTGTRLRVTGWAWLRGLDMRGPTEGTTVRAWLVDTASRTDRIPLEVEQERLAEADEWGPLAHASPAGGGFVATVDLTALVPGSWFVEVQVEQDGLVASGELHGRMARSAAVRASTGVVDGLGVSADWDPGTGLTLHVTPGGAVDHHGDAVEVEDAELDGDHLVLVVRDPGERVGDVALVGGGKAGSRPGDRLPLVAQVRKGDRTRLTFALTTADGTDRPAPDGPYVLRPDAASPDCARPGRHLAGRSPVRLLAAHHRVEVGQRPDACAVVVLAAPLLPDELGAVNQHRLQQGVRGAAVEPSGAVFLGAGADQDAADRWLSQHRPDLPRQRGDALTPGSRRWYAALTAAPFVSLQEDVGPWFERRPGQRRLRTLAAHPYEPVGVSAWRRAGLIEHLVDREVLHVHRQWDTLLAPDEESVGWLREQYRWEGEVLVAGSPRTDHLVRADPAAVRERVLRRLGLPDDTVLVLHAPAARDDHDVAQGARGLDVDALAHRLGHRHTVLTWTAPGDRRPPEGSAVRDVTGALDLTDLLLAADVAVLDYSGLRFDRALTGRPMVFHVPDLEPWHEFRRTAFAWEDTAPGPWTRTLDELVEQVQQPARLTTAYAEAVAAFNERFNGLNDGGATARALQRFLSR